MSIRDTGNNRISDDAKTVTTELELDNALKTNKEIIIGGGKVYLDNNSCNNIALDNILD